MMVLWIQEYNPCSYNNYCIEADNGTWSGGYVQIGDESVYISKVAVNKIAGEGETYTFPEYIGSLRSDTMDRVLNQIATSIPIFGQVYDNINKKYTNMTLDIQSELLRRGYTKDSVFFIKRTNMPGTLTGDVRFDVYDVSTGKIITSRIL
ncbi:hypothetical protein AB9N12_03895 [Bacteroides sp. AN502(2024)]|uniref:hypothetical protein n=1 Tax=Bacteroides sp. AN502(2024) TaxID=3160599 RepID=UPI0035164BB0